MNYKFRIFINGKLQNYTTMNIYKVSRSENDNIGYDEYDSFICVAKSKESAVLLHPAYKEKIDIIDNKWCYDNRVVRGYDWIKADRINSLQCELIGTSSSDTEHVILASFNAG